jgi:transcription elongation factor Elf1
VANLFQPKTAVIEYRPAIIDGSYTWYWSLLPLPDEAHAFAHGSAKNRGAAALEARQNARKHGYKVARVRIKHSFTEAAAHRIRAVMRLRESVSSEAAKAEKPTEDQAKAGNYKKGHVSLFGLDISIENAKGSKRTGTNKQGKKWSVTMPAHYGYICGTKGKDKDHIDVYIGPDEKSEKVYVVNQKKEEGDFDEHKCMICFADRTTAIATYDKAFTGDLGPKLRESVVTTTMDNFKEWLKSEDTKTPFKSIAEALLEADPDDITSKAYIGHVYDWREFLANTGFQSVIRMGETPRYEKYIGDYMIVVCDWHRDNREIDVQIFKLQADGDTGMWLSQEVQSVPAPMVEPKVREWIKQAELNESGPDDLNPKDHIRRLAKEIQSMSVRAKIVGDETGRTAFFDAKEGLCHLTDEWIEWLRREHFRTCEPADRVADFGGDTVRAIQDTESYEVYIDEESAEAYIPHRLKKYGPEGPEQLGRMPESLDDSRPELKESGPDDLNPKEMLTDIPIRYFLFAYDDGERSFHAYGKGFDEEHAVQDMLDRQVIWPADLEYLSPGIEITAENYRRNCPLESVDPDDPANYLKTTKVQDCPNCGKNDWEWFTANLKVKSPPRVFRCKNCNLHWRPDMNPAPKSGQMGGCWFPERDLKTNPVYKCPECGSSHTSLPDDEGLVDCLDCGIWFNPNHPNNVQESVDPDDVNPHDYIDQAFSSTVPGYVTHKRPGFEASWQVSRVKTLAGQHAEIPVGVVSFDHNAANSPDFWRAYNWHAAPNFGDGQYYKSFDEAVRYVAHQYRNRYGDPEIEESGPDSIDPKDYLNRVQLQCRYAFDVDLPGDEGYTGSVDLPIYPPAGTQFDDVVEDPLWQEDFMNKLRQTEIDPDDLPWVVEIRYRGNSSHTESEDPDAVDAKMFVSRIFPTRGTIKDFTWALDANGVRAVGIRKQEDGWHIRGHYFGRARSAKTAIKRVLEQFKLDHFPWTLETDAPTSEVTRMFHTIIPLHLLDGSGSQEQSFPPGYMVRT